VLAHRPAARDVAQRYLAAMTPQAADRVRDRLSTLDAVVVTEAGEPVTVLVDGDPTVDADGHGGRVFAHVVDDPEDLWWEKSLAWTLATQFLAAYADIVMALEPRTAQLNVGDRVNPDAQVRRFEQPTTAGKDRPRFCEVLYDPAVGLVSTRTGKVGAVGAVRNRRFADPDRAARKADRLAAKRLADGYVEVTGVEG
jgi:predicted DNA-binding WGR domain protein